MGENEPFGQTGTFLRIHASKPLGTKGRSGILSSLRADAAWPGPLLMHPADVQIVARQTTVPNAADHRKL